MNLIADIMNVIKETGIEKGETVYLSVDLSKLLFKTRKLCPSEDFINLFIDGLKNIIGEDGTILIPAFNWDFCKGLTFNRSIVDSKTGHLASIAAQRQDFTRTQNPIYSFIVSGKKANELAEMPSKTCFGQDSTFHFLYEQHAKQLLIDVPLSQCFTFAYYGEKLANCPYRYDKEFTAEYIDFDQSCSTRTYNMFVRQLDKTVHNKLDNLEELFLNNGSMKVTTHEHHSIRTIDFNNSLEIVVNDVKHNHGRNVFEYK